MTFRRSNTDKMKATLNQYMKKTVSERILLNLPGAQQNPGFKYSQCYARSASS